PPDRFQGTSLLPLLTGQTNTHRENILCQYDNAWTHPDAYATCLRTQSHKITRYHATNEGELYDLENDPHEFENLWSSSDHQSVKQDLLQHLLDRSHLTTLDPHPPRRGPF
ncbi:MAG: sulfatase/phosphatase domain-containing protein, partial [Verrucomicrobiota bacterium]